MSKLRILLVDDHAILREGLRTLLGCYEDMEVVGEAQNGREAVERVRDLQPDIVLMDIAMPEMSGLEATRVIHQNYPQTRVLILTQHEDRQYVLPLLQAGASGYVLKRAAGTDLLNALRTVSRGETFLYPAVTSMLVDEMRRARQGAAPPEDLTEREREILALIVKGNTNAQIASALSLSIKTVEWHRGNLMSKLGAHNAADLVRLALQCGLVQERA